MENLTKENIQKIKRSIAKNNRNDLEKYEIKGNFTFEDFMIKINEQNNKCYVCLQEFKYNGGNYCYFFPSCDRINNRMPHNKENIAISCLFCNTHLFNNLNEKKCGLCEGLDHNYNGKIPTKSWLFKRLNNIPDRINDYINNISNNKYLIIKNYIYDSSESNFKKLRKYIYYNFDNTIDYSDSNSTSDSETEL